MMSAKSRKQLKRRCKVDENGYNKMIYVLSAALTLEYGFQIIIL